MPEPVRNFQHYEVLRREDGSPWELGRGAMGITYKAFDVNLCCEVALKVVNSALLDHPDAKERFVREARAAAALRHRNVASVYHLGNDGEHFFYAMEFIDGETLDSLVRRRGPLPVAATLEVILQVAKALAAAARQQLVHRDIKPSNVMVVHEDADDDMTIKVIDFGLARPVAGVDNAAQLTIGGFVGTPQYASPEQLEERPLDARSDIYSLGITAWYLLTARPPFSGSLATVCQQQLSKSPPWEQLSPELPDCVQRLLSQMLEKDPADRPQDARKLRTEIETCLETLPVQERKGSMRRLARVEPSLASSAKAPVSGTDGKPPERTIAGGRYVIERLLEETHGAKVFRARDHRLHDRVVTIRTLPAECAAEARQRSALTEEVRLIQAAAHPHLVQIYALEEAGVDASPCLVEEAVPGFSLRDLLAARRGAISQADTLHFLAQAAAAADHAESCRLEHLDFTAHHVRVHFPFAGLEPDGEEAVRALLPLATEQWPSWNLKIHPFSAVRPGLELNTWAGGITLLPPANVLSKPVRPPVVTTRTNYLRALAALAYELLGGVPGFDGAGPSIKARTVALPNLNEAGNAVLMKALSDASGFPSCHGFYQALAATLDVRTRVDVPITVLPPAPSREDESGHGPTASLPSSTVGMAMPSSNVPSAKPGRRGADTVPGMQGSTFRGVEADSVAAHFAADDTDLPSDESGFDEQSSSAWERLTLTAGEPARPGLWLLVAATAGLVFLSVFAGVLALLLHRGPTKNARGPGPGKLPLASIATPPVRVSGPLPDASHPPLLASASPSISRVNAPSAPSPDPSSTPLSIQPVGAAKLEPSGSATPLAPTPPRRIAVSLRSKQPGVQVRWHGELLGVTPLSIQLPPGEQELVVSYPSGPETHQTIHLDGESSQANVEIRPMRSDLVPLNFPGSSPRNERGPRTRSPLTRETAPGPSVRVESAVPVAPPPGTDATPVRRPLPLEPFVRRSEADPGAVTTPSSPTD